MSTQQINALAQEIRRVDGWHGLGAGALAWALWPYVSSIRPAPDAAPVDGMVLTGYEWPESLTEPFAYQVPVGAVATYRAAAPTREAAHIAQGEQGDCDPGYEHDWVECVMAENSKTPPNYIHESGIARMILLCETCTRCGAERPATRQPAPAEPVAVRTSALLHGLQEDHRKRRGAKSLSKRRIKVIDSLEKIIAALDEVEIYLAEREDVVDGDYGIPAPNREMTLLIEVREAQVAALSLITPAAPEAAQPDKWNGCIFDGVPPNGCAAWNEWCALPVKSGVRVRAIVAGDWKAAQPESVPMPQNEDQAAAMAIIGEAWLRQNAPHRLKDAAPGAVDDAMVIRAARALSDRCADSCNVNREDNWNTYGVCYAEDAHAVLTAALAHKPDAGLPENRNEN